MLSRVEIAAAMLSRVEIAASGVSSDVSSAGRKHVESTPQNFTSCFTSERITTGKHAAQTADQSVHGVGR